MGTDKKNILGAIDHFKSYSGKMAKDGQWVKDVFDIHDQSVFRTPSDLRRLQIKYAMAQGELPKNMKKNDWDNVLSIVRNPSYAKRDWKTIPYVPIINNGYDLIKGERQRQIFEPSAYDIGLFSRSEKRRLHTMYLQQSLEKTIWEPYRAQITQQYMAENGIGDVVDLDHNDQQQMRSDIDARIQEMAPEEVNDYFLKEYLSPMSEEASMLMEYELATKKFNRHFIDRFNHGYLSNMEASYIYESYGSPRITLCRPDGCSWIGPDEAEYPQDCTVFKYETYRYPEEIISMWGDRLKMSDIEKIDSGYFHNSNYPFKTQYYKDPISPVIASEMVSYYSEQGRYDFPQGIDQNTKEGQEMLIRLKAKFYNGGKGGVGAKVRDCHIVFKSPQKAKQIKRIVNGRIEHSWRDMEYVLNEELGDISEKIIYRNMVWGARKLGAQSGSVYIDVGPVKYTWGDIDDPMQCKLPYFGRFYSKLLGIAEARGPFDRGIPYQIDYNLESARLYEEKGNNIGKVFATFMSLKPDDYTWPEYVDLLKGNKLMIIDELKLNRDMVSMISGGNFLKAHDLSNAADINASRAEMQQIYLNMMNAMSINEEREGGGSPYESIENNRQKLVNSSNKTLDLYNTHNDGINTTLQGYMEFAHHVYSKNPRPLSWVMDDMQMAELTMSEEFIRYGKVGVIFRNDDEDRKNINDIKQDIFATIQTENYEHMEAMSQVRLAKNPSRILNITAKLKKEARDNRQAQAQAEAAQIKAAQEFELLKMRETNAHELEMKKLDIDAKMTGEAFKDNQKNSDFDINKDGQNDLKEIADDRIALEREQSEKDRLLEREKLKSKEKTDMEKIAASKEIAKSRNVATKNNKKLVKR